MVLSDDNGDGVITAKRGVDAIFDSRHYSEIFPPRPKIASRFRQIYIAYRLSELLSKLRYATARTIGANDTLYVTSLPFKNN
jgi:hypothetical protein